MSATVTDALFEALANGLWRGGLLVIVTALLLRLIKRTTAAERYAVWLAVLTAIALAPAAEVAARWIEPVTPAPVAAMDVRWAAEEWTSPLTAVQIEPRWNALELVAAPYLMLWLAVGAYFAVRLARRCSLAAALKRSSAAPEPELAAALQEWERGLTACRVGATRVSQCLHSPAAVGWLAPAVLLPRSAAAEVHGGDLEMLWRHEQAHVARRDDWTQLLSEALFAAAWFHPAAYWVRRQLEKERELACDEAVLDGGVEAHRYAGALGRWAERAAMSELPAGVMGLGRSRALIIRRIEMLLSPSRILRRNSGRQVFGASLAAAAAVAGLLIVGGPTAIRAQSVVKVEAAKHSDIVVDVSEPVVVIPTLQPEVRIEIPAPVTQVEVNVEPALLSQAAPPAPPTPTPQPAPAPSAAPAPPVPPVPPAPPLQQDEEFSERERAAAEQGRRWREELQPELDEIQREARRIQKYVRESFRPQQEKIQAAAQRLAEEHRGSIAPLAREMAEIGAKIGQVFDSDEREELQRQMQEVAKRMEERRPELQRLEEEIGRIQIDMRPFEQRMKELGEALKEKHEALEEARREFEESNQ